MKKVYSVLTNLFSSKQHFQERILISFFAFCSLLTVVITIGILGVLAAQFSGYGAEREKHTSHGGLAFIQRKTIE